MGVQPRRPRSFRNRPCVSDPPAPNGGNINVEAKTNELANTGIVSMKSGATFNVKTMDTTNWESAKKIIVKSTEEKALPICCIDPTKLLTPSS